MCEGVAVAHRGSYQKSRVMPWGRANWSKRVCKDSKRPVISHLNFIFYVLCACMMKKDFFFNSLLYLGFSQHPILPRTDKITFFFLPNMYLSFSYAWLKGVSFFSLTRTVVFSLGVTVYTTLYTYQLLKLFYSS